MEDACRGSAPPRLHSAVCIQTGGAIAAEDRAEGHADERRAEHLGDVLLEPREGAALAVLGGELLDLPRPERGDGGLSAREQRG